MTQKTMVWSSVRLCWTNQWSDGSIHRLHSHKVDCIGAYATFGTTFAGTREKLRDFFSCYSSFLSLVLSFFLQVFYSIPLPCWRCVIQGRFQSHFPMFFLFYCVLVHSVFKLHYDPLLCDEKKNQKNCVRVKQSLVWLKHEYTLWSNTMLSLIFLPLRLDDNFLVFCAQSFSRPAGIVLKDLQYLTHKLLTNTAVSPANDDIHTATFYIWKKKKKNENLLGTF